MMRVLVLLAGAGVANTAAIPADSDRGAQLFDTLHCVQCHSINGKGGKVGPDLGVRIDRSFTPASLAATMWNHAPAMWAAMSERSLRPGDLDEQAAADLFAFFYSAHFFERPGDASRGKRLFASKHCADCHGLTEGKLPAAKPVAEWQSIGEPMELVDAMWNHGASMRDEFARRKLAWPELTSQDLTDMLVYLRNLPGVRNVPGHLAIGSGVGSEALFTSKGCVACHSGKLALPPRLKGKTLTDIAAAMWNHEPRMAGVPPRLEAEEMRKLVSYLWAERFFEDAGNPTTGGRVFLSKRCADCHNDPSSGAPKLGGGAQRFSAETMTAALWHHGPRMLHEMQRRGIAWPRFDTQQMSNLIAYLNTRSGTR